MTDLTNAILLNLARRLRMARQHARHIGRLNLPPETYVHARGAEVEAWNSFQAAKAIAADHVGSRSIVRAAAELGRQS